jgi:hypothetical protein
LRLRQQIFDALSERLGSGCGHEELR